MGPAWISATGLVAAPGRGRDRRAPRRRGAGRPRRPPRAAGRRPLHGPRGRRVRVRAAASGRRHQHSAHDREGGARTGAARPAVDGPRPRGDVGPAALVGCRGTRLQRGGDGARRHGVHGTRAALRRVPHRVVVRLAPRRIPAVRRPAQGDAGQVRGLRPAGAGTRDARAAGCAPARRHRRARRGVGGSRGDESPPEYQPALARETARARREMRREALLR